ncbi:MAG: hypothetical protein Kow0056_09970 [Coriobacteriia bacterium]
MSAMVAQGIPNGLSILKGMKNMRPPRAVEMRTSSKRYRPARPASLEYPMGGTMPEQGDS